MSPAGRELRVFFATDIHGSDVCFRKFLNAAEAYRADVLILGGDITGKQLVPVVKFKHGWVITEGGLSRSAETEAERDRMIQVAQAVGSYPVILAPDEEARLKTDWDYRIALFRREMLARIDNWLLLAQERLRNRGVRCYMSLGNDDEPTIEQAIRNSDWVACPEGSLVSLDGHEMISWGWSNRTPWHSPREQDESDLEAELISMAAKLEHPESAIFNLHCPPKGSGLDLAPEIDESFKPVIRGGDVSMIPVGSEAVRHVITRFQPLLGLHGHVHDSRATRKIGRTLCINPGSSYQTGLLRGALIQLSDGGLRNWTLTAG